ncbi:hypothetical protein GGH15_001487 [Coemansia sp. RSA 562]|nr:hypothetical protein GGH15_001487 [Coemansia sp. RSA 562]KAJ2717693.1 hypothetical protein H4S00_004144 [Coemansia sp. D1744]
METETDRKLTMQSREQDIYNNCKVLDITGTLLFRAGTRRLEWYLSRNLAHRIDANTIQLNFVNKGSGRQNEPFYLQEMQNMCTICGSSTNLTMHHVVPHQYRKYMDDKIKSRSSHDLLPVCTLCHDKYERHAVLFKQHLSHCFSAPLEGVGWIERKDIGKGMRAASTLMSPSLDKIPKQRIDQLRAIVNEVVVQNTDLFSADSQALISQYQFGVGVWAEHSVLKELMSMDVRIRGPGFCAHGEIIVDVVGHHRTNSLMCDQCKEIAVAGVPALVASWRRHFVEHAGPAYLPNHWSVEYSCEQN